MLRMAYSNTVARSNRLPSSRRRSGMVRKTSSSDAGMGQPPIRVVAYRFRHFRPRESPDRTSKLREMNSPVCSAEGVRALTLFMNEVQVDPAEGNLELLE